MRAFKKPETELGFIVHPHIEGVGIEANGTYAALGYQGQFRCWEDVTREFQATVPEPHEVLLARYVDENYSAEAEVVVRTGDTYSWASGSHCSCMGLKGQWQPETYTRDILMNVLQRRIESDDYCDSRWRRQGVELYHLLLMTSVAEPIHHPTAGIGVFSFAPAPLPELPKPPPVSTMSPANEALFRQLRGY